MKSYGKLLLLPKNQFNRYVKQLSLTALFSKKTDRTNIVRRSIIQNMAVKGFSVLISFLLVRVTFDFLQQSEVYGVWLTILAVLTWINLFDLGLGNGLRNKLAEKIALGQWNEGRQYVSTAYFFLSLIAASLLVVYITFNSFLKWNEIFNIDKNIIVLNQIMSIIVISYFLIFFFSLINSIAYANQNSSIPGLVSLLTNSTIVLLIFVLGKLGLSGLYYLTLIYCGSTLGVLIILSLYLFTNKYKRIRPSLFYIRKSKIKDIVGLGIKFFVLQLMAIVIFSSSSMVILQVLGPSNVTKYQVVLKLFSVFTILSSLIMTPMWSAFTDAYVKKDYEWIRKTVRKLTLMMIPFLLFSIGMIILGNFLVKIWLGVSFGISLALYILMAVYTLLTIWSSIFSYLLNGINKPNIQLITVLLGGGINIPLAVYLSRNLNLGVEGVVLASICALSLFAVAGPIQVYYEFFKFDKVIHKTGSSEVSGS